MICELKICQIVWMSLVAKNGRSEKKINSQLDQVLLNQLSIQTNFSTMFFTRQENVNEDEMDPCMEFLKAIWPHQSRIVVYLFA